MYIGRPSALMLSLWLGAKPTPFHPSSPCQLIFWQVITDLTIFTSLHLKYAKLPVMECKLPTKIFIQAQSISSQFNATLTCLENLMVIFWGRGHSLFTGEEVVANMGLSQSSFFVTTLFRPCKILWALSTPPPPHLDYPGFCDTLPIPHEFMSTCINIIYFIYFNFQTH